MCGESDASESIILLRHISSCHVRSSLEYKAKSWINRPMLEGPTDGRVHQQTYETRNESDSDQISRLVFLYNFKY